ncbi:hypothetical protein SAMN02990966_01117 [Rhodospirillales bacterium URHD0017]|nr:hypothetical protein SAMN02990966_01117 [Rhodospirillales bacterium URHD0017]
MTQHDAQDILTRWSLPWFSINGPGDTALALFEQVRARDPLQAFRLHCLYALVEAAVSRAWQMAAAGSAAPQRDPFARLNRLVLVQWTDPIADPRSSVLRAATNVVYGDNSFRENHVLTGTLTGPFAHVRTSVEMPRTPPLVIQNYDANETPENGFVTFVAMATPARPSRPARRR